jgi:Fe-Mn family superoxide dismutase
MAKFNLMNLPYSKDALAPFLSHETLEFHYGKHHQNYVNKLNELLPGSGFEESSLDEIVKKSTGPLFNNAAQVWNHDFYWNNLVPKSSKHVGPKLSDAITASFGGFDSFKADFEKAATTLFGSGWTWLAADPRTKKLSILQTKDAENPMRQGLVPVLTLDVWEHAYYIDYRNARPTYIQKWWDHVNWDFAESVFTKIG